VNVFGVESFSADSGVAGERLTAVLGKINQLIFGLDGLKAVFTMWLAKDFRGMVSRIATLHSTPF